MNFLKRILYAIIMFVAPKNELKIADKNGKELSVKLNKNNLCVFYNGDLDLAINGNFTMSVNGESNIISKGVNVDSLFDYFNTSIFFNSRRAIQIRNRPETKQWELEEKEEREERKQLALEKYEKDKHDYLETIRKIVREELNNKEND